MRGRLILVLCCLWVGVSAAQEVSPPAPNATEESAAAFEKGLSAFELGRYDEALRLLKPAAESGQVHAQKLMGDLYSMPDTGWQDLREARRWWLVAATAGHEIAQYNLALMLLKEVARADSGVVRLEGDGPEERLTEAVEWLVAAAEQGQTDARLMLAELVDQKSINLRDIGEERLWAWLRTEEARGNLEATRFLRDIYRQVDEERLLRKSRPLLFAARNEADPSSCPKRRFSESQLFWTQGVLEYLFNAQERHGYLPSETPRGFAALMNELRGHGPAGTALFLAYTPEFDATDMPVLRIDAAQAWCLLGTGDSVFVSDRVTHHMMTVFEIDHAGGTISFADGWPERNFLRAGQNAAGIEADIVPYRQRKLVRISREEFSRVFAGFAMNDSAGFGNRLFRVAPGLEDDFRAQLVLAQSMLLAGHPSLMSSTRDHLHRAASLADARLDSASRQQVLELLEGLDPPWSPEDVSRLKASSQLLEKHGHGD